MRATVLTGHGGLDKIEYREDWTTPVPTDNRGVGSHWRLGSYAWTRHGTGNLPAEETCRQFCCISLDLHMME